MYKHHTLQDNLHRDSYYHIWWLGLLQLRPKYTNSVSCYQSSMSLSYRRKMLPEQEWLNPKVLELVWDTSHMLQDSPCRDSYYHIWSLGLLRLRPNHTNSVSCYQVSMCLFDRCKMETLPERK